MMPVTRWDPFRELASLQNRVHRLFSDKWNGDEPSTVLSAWVPPVDIYEKGDDLVVRAEIPGLSREDIDVSVENGTLVLKGEREWDSTIQEQNTYRIERAYGTFARSFTLPTHVDASKIKAVYKDGVLEVTLPKADEAKPKRIEIAAN